MRRAAVTSFQILMALLAFGLTAYSLGDLSGEKPAAAFYLVWVRILGLFLLGVWFTVYAVRNLLGLGRAGDPPAERP